MVLSSHTETLLHTSAPLPPSSFHYCLIHDNSLTLKDLVIFCSKSNYKTQAKLHAFETLTHNGMKPSGQHGDKSMGPNSV